MGIALTDEHRELAEVARAFLTAQKARWAARSLLDATDEGRPGFWQNLVELGWLGLHVDEEHGGSGYGLPELVVVIEELGRAVAPGPFVPTVIASAVIAKDGTAEQKSRLLPGLIDGSVTAGIGLDSKVQVKDGPKNRIADGEAGIVLGAGLAELLLIAAGDDVLLVERGREGVSVDVPDNLDPTRRSGRVRLQSVHVTDADILPGARESALARARTLLAAEAVGGTSDCVDAAVAYAKVRQQFGRTIATFQAVKHHCANMLVAAESATAAVWDAARAAEEDLSAEEAQFRLIAAVAAALAFPAYARNAELNIQVHGGIGFTWEHDAHLHLRRALVTAALFGGDAPPRDVFERTAAGADAGKQSGPALRGRRAAHPDTCRRRRNRRPGQEGAARQADRDRLRDAALAQALGSRGRRGRAARDRGGVPCGGHQAPRLLDHRMGDPDPDPARNPLANREIRRKSAAPGRGLVSALLRTRRRVGCGVRQDPGHPG
jgi:alkylation response protein AidB-like acyl-CoA dehydrogenase